MNRDYPLESVRNFGIIAHIDAGKTTTSERILYYTGMTHKIGEVHEGDTVTDWMEQERERGITITAAAITCFWNPTYMAKVLTKRVSPISQKKSVLILSILQDTSTLLSRSRGHCAYSMEPWLFSTAWQVSSHNRRPNWRYADDGNVPRLCFINKLDRMGASFENSFKSILERLNKNAVRFQIPIGLEAEHNGVVDLLHMKAYYFEGEMGDKIVEKEIPENLLS